jgi:hypothetical protein
LFLRKSVHIKITLKNVLNFILSLFVIASNRRSVIRHGRGPATSSLSGKRGRFVRDAGSGFRPLSAANGDETVGWTRRAGLFSPSSAGFDDQHLRREWAFPVPHRRPPQLRSARRAASRRAATAALRLYAGAAVSDCGCLLQSLFYKVIVRALPHSLRLHTALLI